MSAKRPNPASIFDDWTGFPDSGAPVAPAQRRRRKAPPAQPPGDVDRLAAFLESLNNSTRLAFFEHLAHELTVTTREAFADRGPTRELKIEHMRRLNEIQHRVVLRIHAVRLNKDRWKEAEFAAMIFEWSQVDALLFERVIAALRRAHAYLLERAD